MPSISSSPQEEVGQSHLSREEAVGGDDDNHRAAACDHRAAACLDEQLHLDAQLLHEGRRDDHRATAGRGEQDSKENKIPKQEEQEQEQE